jgi:hypothetical protein
MSEPSATQETEPESETAEPARTLIERVRGARPALLGLFALLLFLLASTALYAWPILGDFGSRFVGVGKGDSRLYMWSLTWLPWAIEHGQNPLFTHLVYAPDGADLTWVTTLPGPALVMWPITKIFGPLASYNALMVAAPALAAWATYLLCHRITKAFWPSVAGGYLFGFSTYLVAQMHGHVNLVLIFPAPLAVYLVVRRVEGSMRPVAFVASLSLTLLGLFSTSTELFATTSLFGALALLGALAGGGTLRRRIFTTGLLVGAAYVVVTVMLLPFLLPAMRNAPDHALRPMDQASLDVLSFVVPRFSTWIGGQRFIDLSSRFTASVVEDGGYLGIPLVLMLVLYAVEEWRSKVTWLLLGFIGLTALLALGPILHVAGREITGLPGAFVGKLPLIEHATPQRFSAYIALAVGVAAAIWLAHARGRWDWTRWTIVLVGGVLLLPDVSSPPYHPTIALPAFITSGAYRDVLEPGEIVYVIPDRQAEEMLWQASADNYFRLAQGYVGPVPRAYRGQPPTRGLANEHPNPFMPSPVVFAEYLAARDTTTVLVFDSAQERFTPLLESLGYVPEHVEDVWVWRPGGPGAGAAPGVATVTGDLREGGSLSAFSLPSSSAGPPLTYDAYRGRPLVIGFVGLGCDGCTEYLAALEELHRSEPSIGVLGVAQSATSLQESGVTFDTAVDPLGAVYLGFQGTRLPLTVLVGADGTIRAIRGGALSVKQLQALVERSFG